MLMFSMLRKTMFLSFVFCLFETKALFRGEHGMAWPGTFGGGGWSTFNFLS